MSKYELTDETQINIYDATLHRIRALRDIPRHGVREGDLGGWIESENNLSQDGDAWVAENAQVFGDAQVYGEALAFGRAKIYGQAQVFEYALVYESAHVFGHSKVFGHARVFEYSWVSGTSCAYGDVLVYGNAWLYGTACVSRKSHLLTATIYTTQILYATAFYQRDWSWHVQVGYWEGSIPELREMAESGKWVDTPPEEIDEARPELLAFVALCEARAARMVL